MPDADKTVFISYRRSVSFFVARAIFMDLRSHDYDVFMDVESIDSGTFDTIILHQIAARAHFLVVLSPGALKRINEPGDWLRREIEHAMDLKRNIVPVLASGFTFEAEGTNLQGKLSELKRYNAVDVPETYFDAAMAKLRDRFLKTPTSAPITLAPSNERSIVRSKIEEVLRTEPDEQSWAPALPGKKSWRPSLPIEEVLRTKPDEKDWMPILPDEQSWAPALDAPKLEVEWRMGEWRWGEWPFNFKWTFNLGATGFVLQKSTDSAFTNPEELYNGAKTVFPEFPPIGRLRQIAPLAIYFPEPWTTYYRVKAKGRPPTSDSAWSNVVEIGPQPALSASKLEVQEEAPLTSPHETRWRLTVAVPKLKVESGRWGWTFKWTSSPGATSYVLQESEDSAFTFPVELYNGDKTEFFKAEQFAVNALLEDTRYYRVKATSENLLSLDNPWSNVVEIGPPEPFWLQGR